MDAEFLECFREINDVTGRLKHVGTMPLSLSTITFTGTLSRHLPVEDMRLAAEIADELHSPEERAAGFRVDCDLLKKRQKASAHAGDANKRFRYQLPLKRNGKSVKVFHNGSVHVTGCTCPLEFLEMMDALVDFVRDTAGEAYAGVELTGFDIQLINTLFLVIDPATKRPMHIPPGRLARHASFRLRGVDFDTERHPSVKIPVHEDGRKVATVCVFQTGSVSIMGARSPRHVAKAFEVVCGALDSCAPDVCGPDPAVTMRTTTARNPLVLEHGYPFNLYACCLV